MTLDSARARLILVLAIAIVVALGAVGLQQLDSDDTSGQDERRTDGPLRIPNPHGWSLTLPTGTEFTDGFEILKVHGREPAVIDDVRIDESDGFELIGVKLVSPDRPIGAVQLSRSWPPRHPKWPPASIRNAIGATITPASEDPIGWELLIGMRVTGEGYLIRDGIEIDYAVGDEKYTAELPAHVFVCTDKSLEEADGCPPADL